MKAIRYLSLLPLVCLLASLSLAAESAGPDALSIAVDVKGGLIVHVGCGDGAITAALNDALSRGIITPAVKDHLEKRLGLA